MKKNLLSLFFMLFGFCCQAAGPFTAPTGCIIYNAENNKLTLRANYNTSAWGHVSGQNTWIYVRLSPTAPNYIGPFPATYCDPVTESCEYDISSLIGSLSLPGCYEFFTVSDKTLSGPTAPPPPGVVPPTNPSFADVYPPSSPPVIWSRPPYPQVWDVCYEMDATNREQYGRKACACPENTDPLQETGCTADFMYQSFSFNPKVFEVFPTSPFFNSTYMVNWGDGSGFVPLTSSHLYAPGNYTLCLKEYRNGMEFCMRCKDICVNDGISTVPDETTCDFVYRSYSNVGRVLEVIPYLMPAGVSVSDYKVNWGDLSPLTAPTSSHVYATDGNYTVCLSRYNMHPYGLICEKCISVCLGGGGGLSTGRTTGIEEHTDQSLQGQLYPNPTSDQSVLQFQLDTTVAVSVQVTDITGKIIQHVFNGILKQGVQNITIDTKSMPVGMYIVNTKMGTQSFVQKLHVIR